MSGEDGKSLLAGFSDDPADRFFTKPMTDEEYQAHMDNLDLPKDWVKMDGTPCAFHEGWLCDKLIEIFKGVSVEHCPRHTLVFYANMIYGASQAGKSEQLPRFQPLSEKASFKELDKLLGLLTKLSTHLNSMHRPAMKALFEESLSVDCDVYDFMSFVDQYRIITEAAYGEIEAPENFRSAPTKHEAKFVGEAAGHVYRSLSGKKPTFTTDPIASEVSGEWPYFLQDIFDALYIKASPASQLKALSKSKANADD